MWNASEQSKKRNLLIFVTARLTDPSGAPITRGGPGLAAGEDEGESLDDATSPIRIGIAASGHAARFSDGELDTGAGAGLELYIPLSNRHLSRLGRPRLLAGFDYTDFGDTTGYALRAGLGFVCSPAWVPGLFRRGGWELSLLWGGSLGYRTVDSYTIAAAGVSPSDTVTSSPTGGTGGTQPATSQPDVGAGGTGGGVTGGGVTGGGVTGGPRTRHGAAEAGGTKAAASSAAGAGTTTVADQESVALSWCLGPRLHSSNLGVSVGIRYSGSYFFSEFDDGTSLENRAEFVLGKEF